MPTKLVRRRCRVSLLSLLLLGVAACDDNSPTGPIEVPESQLEFISLRSQAPPLETMDTSFWAVPGEDRELEIRYVTTGNRFLRLRVDKSTVLRLNGAAVTDSAVIRVVVDNNTFRADFSPEGLEFGVEPAELEIRYDMATNDFLAREDEFDVWRQEKPDDPWRLLASDQIGDFRIKADVDGFTRYALAIGR